MKKSKNDTPIFNALKKHMEDQVIPFHVPGHKYGRGLTELKDFLGQNLFSIDLNSMEDLDNLNNPVSVIEESQKLTADAFHAERAYYLVNGTTSGIHAMIMATMNPGQEIILPRNVHRSVFSGLILSGANPVYVPVKFNSDFGLTTNVSVNDVKLTLERSPHARAVLLVNPNYYGIASDIREIVKISHEMNCIVLADEAHGCLFGFYDELPPSAMEAGADICAVSTHKTGGSLTQSSLLLVKSKKIIHENIQDVLNILQSTSASYLLLTSIELARKQLALYGKEMISKNLDLVRYARDEVKKIDGLSPLCVEHLNDCSDLFLDETKLVINVHELGVTGFEVEKILREEYQIQIELSDSNYILAIVTFADEKESIDSLVSALKEISINRKRKNELKEIILPEIPEVIINPREAFNAKKRKILISEAENHLSGEMLMLYPPGVPILCPGELITKEIVDYIHFLKSQDCNLHGTADPDVDYLRVLGSPY